MAAMFGHRWASQYGTSPAGIAADTWATCLSGLSPVQIANGMREVLAVGDEFPPSSPRFRAMCLGIPSLASVRYCMRHGEYDRFAALVYSKLDRYVAARVDMKTEDRLIREAYELAREHVMRGGALPEPPVAQLTQAQDARTECPPEVAAVHIAELDALLGPA